VNFLRDIQGDFEERGNIYLPDASDHKDITDANKEMLEKEIEAEFDQSLKGIKRIAEWCEVRCLFRILLLLQTIQQIRKRKIAQILDRRTRIPIRTSYIYYYTRI
jgi:phytoene/squalene synthetase